MGGLGGDSEGKGKGSVRVEFRRRNRGGGAETDGDRVRVPRPCPSFRRRFITLGYRPRFGINEPCTRWRAIDGGIDTGGCQH